MLTPVEGESVYKEAQQELTAVGEEASKGFEDLRSSIIKRTRGLSQAARPAEGLLVVGGRGSRQRGFDRRRRWRPVWLRTEATKRLKEIEKAEDAADEALLKSSAPTYANFLRDAVTIAPPSGDGQGSSVLFESKDAHGK